ncbi:magnesium and cobalt transport protein CorA [uncultured Microbacterium sp.]|uniref:magnesium and cobalt transport protein CorA n=1 Tax=uncultured Microbacterium sp. TaxID=191216 RepID=UPI0025EFB974|nr:magnesium and cobalt transport protein CorA [uncultured Microbacterium sp.]
MALIDNAIYVAGVRVETPASLDETFERLSSYGDDTDAFCWIGLYRPDENEVAAVESEFGLHPLAIEDTLAGHQRAKLERYGDTLFVVLRPADYDDDDEEVDFGEVHVFVGPNFVITIRHAEAPDLAAVRHRLEGQPELLTLGPEAVLYAVIDRVVDDYQPVVDGIENDIDEIEDQLFGVADDDALSRRIYELYGEVLGFGRAVHPLIAMIEMLRDGYEKYDVDLELRRALRDVYDHVVRYDGQIDGFRALLDKALTTHATLVAQRQTEINVRQNEEVKKISSWAAIIFAPGLISGIYGMNFDNMPELHWDFGYPIALAGMAAFAFSLYLIFKKRHWL